MVQTLTTKHYVCLVVVAAACYSIGRFTGPTKVETKEVQKVVYKERVTRDRETSERETKLPDGTVIKERETRTVTDRDRSNESETTKEMQTTNRPTWRISGGYMPSIPSFQEPRYTAGLERQVIGEIYAGIVVGSDKTIGVTISIGF